MRTFQEPSEALNDIKQIMERSSRFISLSGWSGIAAGVSALAGAWIASVKINDYRQGVEQGKAMCHSCLVNELIAVAIVVLLAAFVSALVFTYLRSKDTGVAVWGTLAMRLLWNTMLPMVVGAIVILHLLEKGNYVEVAPYCLIFYGLALVNGSKYTLGEVRYLGYGQIILGLVNLWFNGYAILFWAMGFGVLHIVYGSLMWWKYERPSRKGMPENTL